MSLLRAPVLKHGQTVWNKTHFSEREIEARVQRVRTAMQAEGFDVLIACGDSLTGGNSLYLSNFAPWEPRMLAGAIVTPTALEAALQIASRNIPFVQPYVWARVHTSEEGIAGAMRDIAVEHHLERSRVAFAGWRLLPQNVLRNIESVFAAGTLTQADHILENLRRCKSAAEHCLIRFAASRAEHAMAEIVAHVKPGILEFELAAFADYAFRRSGCQDVDVLVYTAANGPHVLASDAHFPFRPASPRPLSEGGSIGLYVAAQYHGYWLELSQSVYVEPGSRHQRESSRFASACFEEMLRRTRPRVLKGDLAWHDGVRFRWVHGIGLDREETPRFSSLGERLESDDIIAAHLAVRINEDIVFKGRTAIVSETGSTLLASSP